MKGSELNKLRVRVEHMKDEELLARRDAALGAIAYINAHLEREPENIPESSQKEMKHSRKLFHNEKLAYQIELTKRGIL